MLMMAARPWWRVLVGDMFGGARRIVRGCGFLGTGEILVGLADTDAATPAGAVIPS
jgi:hypothetical protein